MANKKKGIHYAETDRTIPRRKMLELLGYGAISAITVVSCRSNSYEYDLENDMAENGSQIKDAKASQQGRLLSRPLNPTKETLKAGRHSLQVEKKREALIYVPKRYDPKNPAPLALMLHGAGGTAVRGLSFLQDFADEAGIIVLSPQSKASTWDVIANEYGTDVKFIDLLLEHTFERFAIDKSRLAVCGFSDGASYALSLGIINGELFSHIIAFSPGYMAPTMQAGKPNFYISHGTKDRVLPIEKCSRKIVQQLKDAGYDVVYKEFDGPHTIPPNIVRESVQWLTAK